jgi:copper resistance protein B
MKNPSIKPAPCALVLACLLSANAAAQTAAPTQPPQSTGSHDMSTMDHSKMGHGTPASAGKKTPQQAPPDPAPSNAAAAGHAGHAGHGNTAEPPKEAPPAPAAQHQDHATGHSSHAAQPAAPTKPLTQPTPTATPGMDHAAMGHGAAPAAGSARQEHAAGTGGGMAGHAMQMGPMQGGAPPPDARDPNAYNEGTRHANFGNHEMNDNAPFGKVLVDKLEAARGDGEHGQNLEAEAWYGNDYNKAWVKVEGERRGGSLESSRTELLWDRAFAPFWSTQLGVRHDGGDGGGKDWLAVGVQGLAPYWFETEATAYWRSGSGFAARLNAKYEILFTPRLILEPELSANLYSRADPEHGTGNGVSDLSVGLRLRYEVTRKFAPYIGVTWNRQFGETADFTRMRGGDPSEVQAVAGVRLWF